MCVCVWVEESKAYALFKCIYQLSGKCASVHIFPLWVCANKCLCVCVCFCAWSSQTRCNNWRPSCRFHTINMATLEVMKVNQGLKGELVEKSLSENRPLPPTHLNYPHNGLLMLYPSLPHSMLFYFLSFATFHITGPHSYYLTLHISISNSFTALTPEFLLLF